MQIACGKHHCVRLAHKHGRENRRTVKIALLQTKKVKIASERKEDHRKTPDTQGSPTAEKLRHTGESGPQRGSVTQGSPTIEKTGP